jgi:flagellar motor switch protein FliM
MSPAKAMRVALPKAADHAMDLPLMVSDVTRSNRSREAVLSSLEDSRLYLLIQTADERLGMVVPDPSMLAGLIEIQTMGHVTEFPATDRQPTRTDASMMEPFIEAVLAEFVQQLSGMEEAARFTGYSYYRLIEDRRHLPLILVDGSFACFDVAVDLGQGAKQASMMLAFPELPESETVSVPVGPSQRWMQSLETGVMGARVDVGVDLHSFMMSLEKIPELVVGYEIEIPRSAVQELRVKGSDGKTVARGKIGQANGHRAVKFSSDLMGGAAPAVAEDPLGLPNPLEAMGGGDGPVPVTSTGAAGPTDTGVPDSFADLSPPEEEMAPLEDFPAMGAMDDFPAMDAGTGDLGGLDDLPPMGDLPAMDDLPPMGDLPAMDDFPSLDDLPPMGDLPDIDFPN